jgi:protein ECT2
MNEEENDSLKPLLNNQELKIIFGNLSPIYEIHRFVCDLSTICCTISTFLNCVNFVFRRMLEELKWAVQNWSEERSIGKIIYKFAPDLVKGYPPYVNFFENMKEMLNHCDKENPRYVFIYSKILNILHFKYLKYFILCIRFHAFLKVCQTKPECGRQSLQELLIRPVQRLPSIILLLDGKIKLFSYC